MSERTKMLAGELYDPTDPELAGQRLAAHRLCQQFNQTFEEQEAERQALIDQLLPDHATGVFFQGPIFFDYGRNSHIGANFYSNVNLTVLDTCDVTIGDNVMLGPNVTLATPLHPLRYQQRNLRTRANGSQFDLEYGKPLTIEDNCWLASNVTVTGGVTIGEGSVIGAGSIVTRDIPAHSLAVGNPCRVIRPITPDDTLPE